MSYSVIVMLMIKRDEFFLPWKNILVMIHRFKDELLNTRKI